ncbi:MAG: GAF domain-containing protein [Candidatus Dadabacteria bacterium]|nr:GAF domain-containing protein [Candidatus Dadabacteria bacterium]NIS08301.1 GAF domain-containing protein [Candidatus Dadabacteria bacterium]NIV41649.1 GAF domain-containing protein [Candidatus Dadabacteria bacterium]NIY21820.1 GAF domain-containing protein [Candidatus Dadabacteria bacterium]
MYKNNKPLIVNDLAKKKRFEFDKTLYNEGVRSYVVVPLIAMDVTIGTLHLGSMSPDRFRDVDREFLSLVAKQVALAINNANCIKEIEELKEKIEGENVYLQEEIKLEHNFEEIVGHSTKLKEVLKQIELVAKTDSTVLIRGETGTGKELIARAIHNLSSRKDRPLIKLNFPAIPARLIESELFGHEKRAFTTAILQQIGKFELADCGTIFLDELGDLPLDAQAKLLRAIQEREFERVGGNKSIHVDVRIIAATNRSLEDAVSAGTFRSDLFFRLNVFPINIPPLRERKDDILVLSKYFIQKYMNKLGKDLRSVSDSTLKGLLDYSWPGNIRELENIIERAVILSTIDKLRIPKDLFGPAISSGESYQKLDDLERNHILQTLNDTGWRISGDNGAAKILGINPNTLRSKMQKLGISKPK